MTNTLAPVRYPQGELFVADIADAVLKDDMASMEHPVFSLSKRPDMATLVYENTGKRLEVRPSTKGRATIFDKDVLIFAISQLVAAKNEGRTIKRELTITPRDLLMSTNRETGGRAYGLLEDALDRLQGTQIHTNIQSGGRTVNDRFSLIDSGTLVRNDKTGRIESLVIKLSDWTYNAVMQNDVLTLHRDYFRLRKPIERRIYEIARKHCGQKSHWSIGLRLLKEKTGSASTLAHFKHMLSKIAETDHVPDYHVALDADSDMVHFENRAHKTAKARAVIETSAIMLSPDAHNDARSVAPGWDVYMLEQEWRNWMVEYDLDTPKDADKAFIGFCRKWNDKRSI